MSTVTKRELNQQTSRVLAAVEADGAVIVTEHGVPKWRIEAVTAPSAPIDRLRAAGRVLPAKTAAAPWHEVGEFSAPDEVDALLAELREDDRL